MEESLRRHCRVFGLVVAAGLSLAGLGFIVAGVRPGAGPRLVLGGPELVGLYLPPVLAGLAVLLVAAVVASWASRPWAVLGGGAGAVVLLAGSASVGLEGIVYRLGHPGDRVPFVADGAQLLGELVAAVAAAGFGVWLLREGRTSRGTD